MGVSDLLILAGLISYISVSSLPLLHRDKNWMLFNGFGFTGLFFFKNFIRFDGYKKRIS